MLTTPTHSLLHRTSSLKPAGKRSGYLRTTSPDSLSHSSQLSTPCELGGTKTRQAASNVKVPTESTFVLHIATDKGSIHQMNQQTTKASNTGTPTDSMVHEDEHSVLGQSYNTSGVDEYKSDDCLVHKGSRSSSLSAEVRSVRKRDVYSYISSEEDGGSIFCANTKPKVPQKKKKAERALPKKHGIRSRIDDKTCTSISKGSRFRSSRTTTYREEAGNKRQSSPLLRSKIVLRYPGYSSGWSSSDSETSKKNILLTQTTSGDEKEKSDDQFSAPSSINSAVSTSSWTSSERENQKGQALNNVLRQLESDHGVDCQVHEGDGNHHSDSGGVDVNNIKEQVPPANLVPDLNEQESLASIVPGVNEQESPANVVSGLNEQESPANFISGLNKQESLISGLNEQEPLSSVSEENVSPTPSHCGVEDIPDTHESTPFAPDSVDLDMEPQIQDNTSEPQCPVASQLDVTVIPETQETLTDSINTGPVVQCPGSPVIPLQNEHPDLLSPLHVPANVMTVGSITTKTSGIQPSFSDMDSHMLQSIASDTSEDQAKDHVRTKLLGKVKKKHSKYMYMHSDVGDSSSTTESGGGHSCGRRRKAKLISRMLGTSHLNKHPYRRGLSRTNLDSRICVPRSDSEFVHPCSHQLTSASLSYRRRKGLKLRKVRNSAASKTESDDLKKQQMDIPVNEQRSRYSEGDPLIQVKIKQKPSEADSGVSSTNLSEIAQSPSTSDAQQNPESHTMTIKSKSKKRISREVINISSDSESVEFEPPPFKKRKPRPNYSHQRKQKPSLIDEVYSSAETMIDSSQLNVDDLGTATTEKETSTSLCTPKVDCDSKIPGVSTQQPLTDERMHPKSSHIAVAGENTTDEPASCTIQHENIGQMNCSEHELQSTTERVLGNKVGRQNGGDKSESNDSSTSDRDEGMKGIDGIKLSAKRDSDILQKLEDKRCTGVDKLSVANCSASSSSDDSIDETIFQGTIGKLAATHSPLNEGSKVVKDIPSFSHSKQMETLSKMKDAASPEQQSVHNVMPLSCADSAPDESKQDPSDSDDNTDVQRTAVPTQQPNHGDTKEQARESAGRSAHSSPNKSSLRKTLQSYTSTVHRPPRFLFSRSTLKKNYSQQLSELKNPSIKTQGNLQSENSTGKMSRLMRITLL